MSWKSNLIIGIIFFASVFLLSCSKSVDSFHYRLNSDEVELSYKETQCADPWAELSLNESYKNMSKVEILKIFLEQKQISVLEVDYVAGNDSDVVTCTGCLCYTGGLYYVKAIEDQNIIKKLLNLGFVLTE